MSNVRRVHELFIRHGIAAVSSGAVLLLSLLIHSKLDLAVLPTFLAAVMLSAWRGGWGPGVAATILSSLAATYFFMPPIRSLALPQNIAEVAEYTLSGAVIWERHEPASDPAVAETAQVLAQRPSLTIDNRRLKPTSLGSVPSWDCPESC